MRFPKQILVTQEQDGDTRWLSANKSLDDMDAEQNEGATVAVYKLVETKVLKVAKTLVARKEK